MVLVTRLLRPLTALAVVVALASGCTSGDADAGRPDEAGGTTIGTDEAPQERGPRLTYVALGDSYTSGPGLPGADPDDPCQRAADNYPAQVAEALAASYRVELRDRSCGGADTTDLTAPQVPGPDGVPPQADALDRGTDLVTIGLGGNDLGVFGELVGGCVALGLQDPAGSPCTDAAARDGNPLDEAAPLIEQRLVDAVAEVRERAPRAQVLLVGYPQLVPARGDCFDLLPIAAGDLPLAREVNRGLSDAVERAAEASGVGYVDVWAASRGHDICAVRPWVSGQAGDPSGAVPFHPLPAEQEAVARLVLEQVEG